MGFFDEVYFFSKVPPSLNIPNFSFQNCSDSTCFSHFLSQHTVHLIRSYSGDWACEVATDNGHSDIPVICSVDEMNFDQISSRIKSANYVWATNQLIAETLNHRFGVNRNSILLNSHFIETDFFRPLTNDSHQHSQQAIFSIKFPGIYRILHFAEKSNEEETVILLEALLELPRDYVLIIITPEYSRVHQRFIEQFHLGERVFIVSSISKQERLGFYSFSSVLCNFKVGSLQNEMILLEAMATGTPVITSSSPPASDYVYDEYNSLLLNDFNQKSELVSKIQQASTNATLREKLKANGRKTSMRYDKFVIDKWTGELYRFALNYKTPEY